MNDNKSAFKSDEYDEKIKQTLPYYDAFYEQVIDLVKILKLNAVRGLDIGCGIGKMGSVAFENVEIEKFVFRDSSEEMIRIDKERFKCYNAEFSVCDVQKLVYANESLSYGQQYFVLFLVWWQQYSNIRSCLCSQKVREVYGATPLRWCAATHRRFKSFRKR